MRDVCLYVCKYECTVQYVLDSLCTFSGFDISRNVLVLFSLHLSMNVCVSVSV